MHTAKFGFFIVWMFSFLLIYPLTGQDSCTQLNYHTFKAQSLAGQYIDLDTLGILIETPEIDDGNSEPQEIGFPFEFQCQTFTQFILSTNGFIKLGSEPLSSTDIFFNSAQSTEGGIFDSAD